MKKQSKDVTTLSHDDLTKLKIQGYQIWASIDSPINFATSKEDKERLRAFIKQEYPNHLPELAAVEDDPFFENSFNFYTNDKHDNITSTVSLVMDNPEGLPEELLFHEDIEGYRLKGLKCIQIGRFINTVKDENRTLRQYFRLFYQFSIKLGFDILLGMVKQKHMGFHKRVTSAKILNENTGVTFGSEHLFGTAAWELQNMKSSFFEWIGEQPITKGEIIMPIYAAKDWNQYAKVFGSVQTQVQHQLQHSSIEHLSGDVVDLGCGCAKLAALMSNKLDVTSYLGIDASAQMIEIADWLISQFNTPTFSTFTGKIEDFTGRVFDSAVSLNSFYAWPDPSKILRHIYNLLKPDGTFVLATLNPSLDLFAIDKEERKELILNPDYQEFREHNLALLENDAANLLDMDELVHLLRSSGFKLVSCHQEFYHGGVNFIVLRK